MSSYLKGFVQVLYTRVADVGSAYEYCIIDFEDGVLWGSDVGRVLYCRMDTRWKPDDLC